MIEFDWDMGWIKEQFGEIPPDVSYDQNILSVLNDIQSDNGYYFRKRQDINRDIRNRTAFIEEIAEGIPAGYDVNKWESENLSTLYKEIETIRKENEMIERANQMADNRNNKIRKFEADKEIAIAALDKEMDVRTNQIAKEVIKLTEQIKALEVECDGLCDKKADKLEVIEQKYKADIATFEAEIESYKEYIDQEIKDLSELTAKAELVEEMKGYVNEYNRMLNLQDAVSELQKESKELTIKIEKARTLPGEILETATIPIKDLSIKDGVPLIKGLPVSNLSDGQKLDLCIDVSIQNSKGLQIILIDGVEKLSTKLRNRIYEKCKDNGLQFIATRTDDSEDLTVVEL